MVGDDIVHVFIGMYETKFRRSVLPLHISRSTLKMEAAGSYETVVSVYQSTRRRIPKDWKFHQRCTENLKSSWPDASA